MNEAVNGAAQQRTSNTEMVTGPRPACCEDSFPSLCSPSSRWEFVWRKAKLCTGSLVAERRTGRRGAALAALAGAGLPEKELRS